MDMEYKHTVTGNIVFSDVSESIVHEYVEQYEGYFSHGWQTNLSAEAAFRQLEQIGIVATMGDFEINEDSNGGWSVDTEVGSIYWCVDSAGITIAGILAPDDLNPEYLSTWRSATIQSDDGNETKEIFGYV